MKNGFVFGVGLTSNKETNDFLRCLWSRLSATFGGIGWQYMPMRNGSQIFVGYASLGKNILLNVTLYYKQRGCLSKIEFSPSGYDDESQMQKMLKKCVDEALCSDKYLSSHYLSVHLDKNLSFKKKCRENFIVEGNKLILKINGFDMNDCVSMLKAQSQQVCDLMTFDTLRYVTVSGTLMEEIREKHNFKTDLVDMESEEVTDTIEKNEMYRNLDLSEEMADYINQYLERPYMYEEHFTLFETCTQLFAQGIRNEELSRIMVGLPEPYTEQAITNYMSALEIITLKDKEPETCDCCGQMKYSIARRVKDLASNALHGGNDFANRFYGNRSKYVHTGTLLSSNSYTCCSIPLMSKSSQSGTIDQVAMIDNWLKEGVKQCIVWHEKHKI